MENALSSLALDLSHDGISLHRLESGTWIVLDHIPLQVGTLKANMSRLRGMADSTDGKVLVWMPTEQIHVLPVQIAGLAAPDQKQTIQNAFAEAKLFETAALEFDTGQMDPTGLSPVAAIESGVLLEAKDFLADHGFEATAFSTRTPIQGFGAKPVFSQESKSSLLTSRTLAAAAGIALAVGFGGVIWNSLDLFRSAHDPDFDIVESITAPDQERAPTIETLAENLPRHSELPNADTTVSRPQVGGDFAAFYAFPEDDNTIQISINSVSQTEEIRRTEQLPGPDARINTPPLIAALDPAQSGGTIPNIFTSPLQETVDALLSPFGAGRLDLKTPLDLLPTFRVLAPDALFVKSPETSDAGFSAPLRIPRVDAQRDNPALKELAEHFPVYRPITERQDLVIEPGNLTSLTGSQDQPGLTPEAAEAAARPDSSDVLEIALPENGENSVALSRGRDDTLPLVPLLPEFTPVDSAGQNTLPFRAENLPPPVKETPLEDGSGDLAALQEATDESNIEPNSVAELSASPDAPVDQDAAEFEPVVTSELPGTLPDAPEELEVAALEVGERNDAEIPEFQNRPELVTPDRERDAAILDPEDFASRQDASNDPTLESPETESSEPLEQTPENQSEEEISVIPSAPPVVPPVRPTDETPEEADPEEDVVAALIEEALQEPLPQAGIVDTVRPRMRPDGLLPDTASEAEGPPADAPVRSRYALNHSEPPKHRPNSFASRVISVATSPTATVPQNAPSEPSAPRVQLPTSASVQDAATNPSAINLRNVNLIGVSGSDGRRTALIRMPNGKIVSVNTGDKFSGYQVAAIGRNAVRIRKNGRDTVLEIPE